MFTYDIWKLYFVICYRLPDFDDDEDDDDIGTLSGHHQGPLPHDVIDWDGSVDLYVWLPRWLTVFDIGYLSLWQSTINLPILGHIEIPAELDIPPFTAVSHKVTHKTANQLLCQAHHIVTYSA